MKKKLQFEGNRRGLKSLNLIILSASGVNLQSHFSEPAKNVSLSHVLSKIIRDMIRKNNVQKVVLK
jgi:hypothetical protein